MHFRNRPTSPRPRPASGGNSTNTPASVFGQSCQLDALLGHPVATEGQVALLGALRPFRRGPSCPTEAMGRVAHRKISEIRARCGATHWTGRHAGPRRPSLARPTPAARPGIGHHTPASIWNLPRPRASSAYNDLLGQPDLRGPDRPSIPARPCACTGGPAHALTIFCFALRGVAGTTHRTTAIAVATFSLTPMMVHGAWSHSSLPTVRALASHRCAAALSRFRPSLLGCRIGNAPLHRGRPRRNFTAPGHNRGLAARCSKPTSAAHPPARNARCTLTIAFLAATEASQGKAGGAMRAGCAFLAKHRDRDRRRDRRQGPLLGRTPAPTSGTDTSANTEAGTDANADTGTNTPGPTPTPTQEPTSAPAPGPTPGPTPVPPTEGGRRRPNLATVCPNLDVANRSAF